jgi:hypothetical protein
MQKMTELFPEIFPSGMADTMRSALKALQIAEYEITDAKNRYGAEHRAKIWRSFKTLQPRSQALSSREKLYRVHCREMIDRHVKGEDLRPGTKAEALTALVECSLMAPLNEAGFALYTKLFQELFPDDAEKLTPNWKDWAGREQWPHQNDEQLAWLKRKLAHHRWLEKQPRVKKPVSERLPAKKRKPVRQRYAELCALLGLTEGSTLQ